MNLSAIFCFGILIDYNYCISTLACPSDATFTHFRENSLTHFYFFFSPARFWWRWCSEAEASAVLCGILSEKLLPLVINMHCCRSGCCSNSCCCWLYWLVVLPESGTRVSLWKQRESRKQKAESIMPGGRTRITTTTLYAKGKSWNGHVNNNKNKSWQRLTKFYNLHTPPPTATTQTECRQYNTHYTN